MRNTDMAYMGFKKVEAAVAKGGARNPAAVAAAIGRKKYGKAKFQKAAAQGKKMEGMAPSPKARVKVLRDPLSGDGSAPTAFLGKRG